MGVANNVAIIFNLQLDVWNCLRLLVKVKLCLARLYLEGGRRTSWSVFISHIPSRTNTNNTYTGCPCTQGTYLYF